MSDFLKEKLLRAGYELTDLQCNQFETFYNMLCEWNKVMNLTAITEYEDVVIKHYVDSLMLNCIYGLKDTDSVIDVGTGAGFPGIPLKIMYPDTQFTLLDSLVKRVNFLNELISKTELAKITAIHGRAEDTAHMKQYREQYDICVSRAVANLSTLAEYCLPYVKVGGMFISYKAGNIGDELEASQKAVKILGGEISEVKETVIYDTNIERTFVSIVKIKHTDASYPRKAGTPSKKPL